jgi:tetraacyldisaccharide 4'-kinase
MFDHNWIGSVTFNLPIISVGNLTVGGTGKSPMVEYLASLLKDEFPVATLSRGYKRRTSGYVLAGPNSTAIEIGDEPMQFHLTHPDITVAVGEKRIEAIPQLLFDRPNTKLIILDDAFQHREINAGFNILLTDYSNLYTRDFFLPTGDLRDETRSAKRADILVVTKCPAELSEHDRFLMMKEINPHKHQYVFFTSIEYNTPYHIRSKEKRPLSKNEEVLLVCGIANPTPLTEYIHEQTKTYDAIFFSDHHLFNVDDITDIKDRFERMNDGNNFILTTEKDAVRIMKFEPFLEHLPFYVIPISVKFLFNQKEQFDHLIRTYPQEFYRRQSEEILFENEVEELL